MIIRVGQRVIYTGNASYVYSRLRMNHKVNFSYEHFLKCRRKRTSNLIGETISGYPVWVLKGEDLEHFQDAMSEVLGS